MEISEATQLIQPIFPQKVKAAWADLGCGSGVFTNALASLLTAGSTILAVDKSWQVIQSQNKNVEIEFVRSDFEKDPLPFEKVDGILMANSLHYIKDKSQLLEKIKKSLDPNGKMILIEYDTELANAWVPFPISFKNALKLFKSAGFDRVSKVNERTSIYRAGKMYVCLVEDLQVK